MWIVADGYHWSPSVIDELYIEDLYFWIDGINWCNNKRN